MPKIENVHEGTGILGEVKPFPASGLPNNFMICVSRTTYAKLFALMGTTHGVGDGSTTFNLPDYRGIFLKGAGSQTISGIVHTGTLGTKENDQMQGHRHSSPVYSTATPFGGADTVTTGVAPTGSSSSATSDPISDGTNGTPRVGTVTRPANSSVNYIIRVK